MKTVNLSIVGFGIIGRGVAETLAEKRPLIKRNHGVDLKVTEIYEYNGSVQNEKGVDLKRALSKPLSRLSGWSGELASDGLANALGDIVLELTPGNIETGEPGLTHIREALKSGRHVVTSNKSPLAVAFGELTELAEKRDVELRYEATVGGAMPLINLYRKTLQINEFTAIYGILNGTTNYILSKMAEEGVGLDASLAEAKERGFAETDPTYDLDGIDSAAKVVILANAILGRDVCFSDVSVEGIRQVTSEAVELSKKYGFAVKLICDVGGLSVSPRLVPVNHTLNVSGSLNAVHMKTDVSGDITVVGRGAGPRETSGSILSDVLDVVED